ncbi:hypothetical protein GE300_15870 [Rhodobacteraceae bacterium 2CG4]|uniref:Peptidase metallopeptidase domain-containing protein n=1 Tax=Halovulum marinum TaxID=2662447 RepID=A0A6L5Z3G1_9RHOB|nr:M10 family metallopeptidase [Halovulum marinum]MSU91067.1 hypothetical protein [Halovulum marinum]
MLSQSEIIDGMQFPGIGALNPINEAGAPRFVVTYQFANGSAPQDQWRGYTGWTAMSGAERQAVRDAMDHIETFLNVDFVEVSGWADPVMNLGKVDLPSSVAGEGGSGYGWNANLDVTAYDNFAVFDNGLNIAGQTNLILHELGHAMGLKHSFTSPSIPNAYENGKFTVMSYSANPDNGLDSAAMQLFDILALQDIWGAAANNAGNSAYTGPRNGTVDAVWDSGGIDTFNASAARHDVALDLREGAYSRFGTAHEDVSIAFGTVIENAAGGSGADQILGNSTGNRLSGGQGHDTLKGFGGGDEILGNKGRDLIRGGNGNDTLKGGNANDKLFGQNGNDNLFGGGGADRFVFTGGDDRDRVKDFEDDIDLLLLKGLGLADAADALSHASERNGNVVFDFGNGDVLKVLDITAAALFDDIIV